MAIGSGITLKESDPANIPTPTADKGTIFIDHTNADEPSWKDDAGVVRTLKGAAGPTGATGQIGAQGQDAQDGETANIIGFPSELARRNENNIFGAQTKLVGQYYSPTYDNGNSGAAKTIDWNNGNQQFLTLNAGCTLTFSNPANDGRYVFLINSAGFTVTWPGTVEWGTIGVPSFSSDYGLFTFWYFSALGKYIASYSLGYTP